MMKSILSPSTRDTGSIADVLETLRQPEAKSMIHDIYQAESRKEAEKAFERFIRVFEVVSGDLCKDALTSSGLISDLS